MSAYTDEGQSLLTINRIKNFVNSEIAALNVITIDDKMEHTTVDTVEFLNGSEFLDGLIRLYGAKHM